MVTEPAMYMTSYGAGEGNHLPGRNSGSKSLQETTYGELLSAQQQQRDSLSLMNTGDLSRDCFPMFHIADNQIPRPSRKF